MTNMHTIDRINLKLFFIAFKLMENTRRFKIFASIWLSYLGSYVEIAFLALNCLTFLRWTLKKMKRVSKGKQEFIYLWCDWSLSHRNRPVFIILVNRIRYVNFSDAATTNSLNKLTSALKVRFLVVFSPPNKVFLRATRRPFELKVDQDMTEGYP